MALDRALAALHDPATADERAKQVMMIINLAMLTPSAVGGARQTMQQVGSKAVKLPVGKLNEAVRKRLGASTKGQPTAPEIVTETREHTQNGMRVQVRQRFSIEANKDYFIVERDAGRGNFSVMANRLRERLALQVHLIADARKGGNLSNVVGDVGDEILAAGLVTHWGVKPENILGYGVHSRGKSTFGLKNNSGHGLDMLIKVPPPPEMQIRVPEEKVRHKIEELGEAAQYKTLSFKEETLIVMEVKTTLGGKKTPGFIANTQGLGGKQNTKRVARLAEGARQYWRRDKVLKLDPAAMEKVKMIKQAEDSGKIQYVHAQVFLGSEGKINSLVGKGVGQSSGIQINNWPGM